MTQFDVFQADDRAVLRNSNIQPNGLEPRVLEVDFIIVSRIERIRSAHVRSTLKLAEDKTAIVPDSQSLLIGMKLHVPDDFFNHPSPSVSHSKKHTIRSMGIGARMSVEIHVN